MAKVKCANAVNERIYGLQFTNGISEEFDDVELLNRLIYVGYEVVEEVPAEIEPETAENGADETVGEGIAEPVEIESEKASKKGKKDSNKK